MGGRLHTHTWVKKEEEEEEAQFRFGVWVDTEATVKVSLVTRFVSPRRKRRKSQNIPGKNLSFPRKSFSVKRRRERGASALKSPHLRGGSGKWEIEAGGFFVNSPFFA